MTSFSCYGEANKIGGDKVPLKGQDDVKVCLNFGMSFSFANEYFDDFWSLFDRVLRTLNGETIIR
jgi:hypothetical protein